MERNTEIYVAKKADLAFIPQPGYPDQMQWWYHDAIFDNGMSMVISWFLTDYQGGISCEIRDQDGNLKIVNYPFVRNKVLASTDTLDIRYGDNYMFGEYPTYKIHFSNGDMQVDLVFEAVAMEFREPPDGAYVGRMQAPTSPIYFGYVIRPFKITGKLTISGKEIPVSGHGYGDHQWANASRKEIFHSWYWGSLHLPEDDIFIVWWDGQMSKNFGYQKTKWLWVFKEGKIFEYLRNADMYSNVSDFAVDELSGNTYPRKVSLLLDERRIKGELSGENGQLISMLMRKTIPVWIATPRQKGYYYRFISDFHVRLEIDGKQIETTTKAIHELQV